MGSIFGKGKFDNLASTGTWFASFQWLMFILVDVIVIPIAVGKAFGLDHNQIVNTLQWTLMLAGLAVVFQALFGHQRTIYEGPSGLWFSVVLSMPALAHADGIPMHEIGGSLAVGIIIGGILTTLIGLAGGAKYLLKYFKPGVMGIFMFLFGVKLCKKLMEGMTGLDDGKVIDLPLMLFAFCVAAFVIILGIVGKGMWGRMAMLIGVVLAWPAYDLIFGAPTKFGEGGAVHLHLFALGEPAWNIGIILTGVIVAILNFTKAYGAILGVDDLHEKELTPKQWKGAFTVTGIFMICGGIAGTVPNSPHVSTVGFLHATQITERLPYIMCGVFLFVLGIIPVFGQAMSLLPTPVGMAALFTAYARLFKSGLDWFNKIKYNNENVYRTSIPLFCGIIVMILPSEAFSSIPATIRPLAQSSLTVATVMALLSENLIPWNRIGWNKDKGSKKEVAASGEQHGA